MEIKEFFCEYLECTLPCLGWPIARCLVGSSARRYRLQPTSRLGISHQGQNTLAAVALQLDENFSPFKYNEIIDLIHFLFPISCLNQYRKYLNLGSIRRNGADGAHEGPRRSSELCRKREADTTRPGGGRLHHLDVGRLGRLQKKSSRQLKLKQSPLWTITWSLFFQPDMLIVYKC